MSTLREPDGTSVTTLDNNMVVGGWTVEADQDGHGTVHFPTVHDDAGDMTAGRVVTVSHHSDGETYGFVLQDPAQSVDDGPDVTVWSGLGLPSLLGTSRDRRAVVLGDAPQTGQVHYGWDAVTWDDSGWNDTATSGGHVGQPSVSTWTAGDQWPDERAEWIVGPAWIRWTLSGQGAHEGVEVWLSGRATVRLNGVEVASTERVGDTARATVDLTGDDLLTIRVYQRAAVTVGYDDDGTWQTLYSTSTGNPFEVDSSEVQRVVIAAENPPYPWGSDYPSTGPDRLQGTWRLTVPGYGTTGAIQWDASAAAVKSAVDAVSGVSVDSVTGTGDSGAPFIVTFADTMGNVGSMGITHSDLRHDHSATGVTTTSQGKSTGVARPLSDWNVTESEPSGVTWGYVFEAVADELDGRGLWDGITGTTTATQDSDSTVWDVSLESVTFRADEQAGDLLRLAAKTFRCHMDVTWDAGWQVDCWDDPGTDLSGSVSLDGYVVDGDVDPAAGETITHVWGRVSGGAGWIEVASGPRREMALQVGSAETTDEIVGAAEQAAEDVLRPWQATLSMADGRTPRPFTDFGVWDVVDYDGRDVQVHKIEVERLVNRLEYRVQVVET